MMQPTIKTFFTRHKESLEGFTRYKSCGLVVVIKARGELQRRRETQMRLEEVRDNSMSNCPKRLPEYTVQHISRKKRKEENDKNYTNMPRLNFSIFLSYKTSKTNGFHNVVCPLRRYLVSLRCTCIINKEFLNLSSTNWESKPSKIADLLTHNIINPLLDNKSLFFRC